ncbi:MAG: tRNA preQ1(34) S-adenosylmethionine ribosyltransferase-isomerase QueA [Patescibacteria group bacterium]|jgi:S-adenosylmethionine:tRNA ribosyltransferase-isomerase|nr:tRNA preQ1(34) S-adenosylmethionine ribosyltransferase-isomerase QueA [bacterium]HQC50013.1 tRNA preQ1(34) S-adenosylmethionine ribosyltransferase-isomerase QueA [bacterium]
MKLKTHDFFYNLPSELIAQHAIRPRDKARLLVLNRKNKDIKHHIFCDIIDYLNPGDLLILNNSKVFPARLLGKKVMTGGQVEVFLHQQKEAAVWECLIGGRVKIGTEIIFSPKLKAVVIKNNEDGTWLVKFNLTAKKFFSEVNRLGRVPLPPYIKRINNLKTDKQNYQTVFADDKKLGSVAAPTAGLHFTKNLLKKIEKKGVKIKFITLQIGLGTFSPVKTKNISEHKMHSEFLEIPNNTIKEIIKTKQSGGRVIAVGTTSCRALEAMETDYAILKNSLINLNNKKELGVSKKNDNIVKQKGLTFWTDIFIYPGYKFKVVDALITNFHLPESTLLMLVSAFAGRDLILKAYQIAIFKKYRFFSYGDAMLIS